MPRKKKPEAKGVTPVLLFAAALVVALLLGLGLRYLLTASGDVPVAQPVTIGGPFALNDSQGTPVTDQTYRGKYMLVYFGYTYCPDVCPTSLGTMVEALALIGPEKAQKIQPVMITLDPERDTPERLGEFVRAFHSTMVGLTGSLEDIAKAAKAYRVYFAKVKTENAEIGYLIDHSAQLYLMGPDGVFIRHFTHGTEAADMAKALRESVR